MKIMTVHRISNKGQGIPQDDLYGGRYEEGKKGRREERG
jgi:hypothetical protein